MRTKALGVAIGLAAVLVANAALAQEAPEPLRYPPSSVRVKLVAGGLVLSAGAYGVSYLAASAWPDVPGSTQLKIPVAGPWLALAKDACSPDDPNCGVLLYIRAGLEVLDGLIQLGGLGVAGEGIFMTTEAPAPRATARAARPSITLRPAPLVTAHTTGAAVVGAF